MQSNAGNNSSKTKGKLQKHVDKLLVEKLF